MDENWNAFESAVPDEVIAASGLGEPIKTELPNQLDIARRRMKGCVQRFPDAETGKSDPRCCRWRFGKPCFPYVSPQDVEDGRVTDEDLEVL